ncbi:MAG: hypothetical protein ABR596_06150 [Halarsenatibacteraceae bacterium]
MKNLKMIGFLCILLVLLSTAMISGQEVNQVEQTLNENEGEEWTGYNIRAGFGPEIGWLRLDLDDLNNILAANTFPELNNNIFIYGSSGVAGSKIGNRFGGLTLKGSNQSKAGDKLTRLSINYYGLVYERGFYAAEDLEFSAGAIFGTGGMELRLLSDKPGDFESIVGDIADGSHNSSTMGKSFLALNPQINMSYSLVGPIDIAVSAGYLFTYDFNSNWEIAGNEITGGPLSNFRALNLTFQLYIGF